MKRLLLAGLDRLTQAYLLPAIPDLVSGLTWLGKLFWKNLIAGVEPAPARARSAHGRFLTGHFMMIR